jgi:uncharacterized circularly permuted ATP-grasp superfamily protein
MRSTTGAQRVDVIYRRIDDSFLDPQAFRPDSVLGVPGLFAAHRAGNVSLANAIGTGVADDKSIYPYVPAMIRFYLGEEPILQNVQTWQCREADDLKYVLGHLDELVVKEVQGSRIRMPVGPASTKCADQGVPRAVARQRWQLHRAADVPALHLPDFVKKAASPAPRRPAPVRLGGSAPVPGGLTRVALKAGRCGRPSQGGGTKDTWVVDQMLRA